MKKKNYFQNRISPGFLLIIALFIRSPMDINAQSLNDYKWKNRIVFLIDNTIDSKAMQQQFELFEMVKEEMADRDLILFLASEISIVDDEKNKVGIPITELRKIARIESDFKGVVLLGKDGGYKLKKDFQVLPKEIFDLIDGMPMRQVEIKNKR